MSLIKTYFVAIFLLLAAACNRSAIIPSQSDNLYTIPIQVGKQKIFVRIVKTKTEMEQGLSGKNSLANDQGMLFDFTNYPNKTPAFWMKDMQFDLDLIWVKDNKIISINKKIPRPLPGTALSQLPTYSPPQAIDWVLEVNGGWSEKYNVNVGDEVLLN